MSDQPGLSIFDSTNRASTDSAFPMARRGGYDTDAVDTFLRSRAADFERAEESAKASTGEATGLRKKLAAMTEKFEAVKSPTYSGLGTHAAQLLGLAEQEAEDVRSRAVREADDTVKTASEEAAVIRASAAKVADDVRGAAVAELEAKRKQLLDDAEARKSEAEAEAESLLSQTKREAAQLKLAAEQEANNMRTGATREVEQTRAGADREVTEARRVLAVEKERLARDAAEAHTVATGQTSKLISDSETRAAAAEDRARTIITQANKGRDVAATEAASTLKSAKRESERLLTSARNDAEQIRANAASNIERQERKLRAEIDELQRKRDGIMAQMGQLRDIVASFAPAETKVVDKLDERVTSKEKDVPASKNADASPKQESDTTHVMKAVTDDSPKQESDATHVMKAVTDDSTAGATNA